MVEAEKRTGRAAEPASIVVEVRGGVLTEVYTDVPDARLIVIDWDNIESGDTAVLSQPSGLEALVGESRARYEAALRPPG